MTTAATTAMTLALDSVSRALVLVRLLVIRQRHQKQRVRPYAVCGQSFCTSKCQ